jgi:hypothetical protein
MPTLAPLGRESKSEIAAGFEVSWGGAVLLACEGWLRSDDYHVSITG